MPTSIRAPSRLLQNTWTRALAGAIVLFLAVPAVLVLESLISAQTADPCAPPSSNPIVCENARPGAPETEWDIQGAGDTTIQGFATDISVDQGQTIRFKVDTDASAYRLDIYRLGYYGGLGARKIATVLPSVPLPQSQPACLNNSTTGLVDCGNWSESASWAVPTNATSGIYVAKLVRTNNGGASHIVFIVRDDDGHSDLLFQTSDTTWQAYNDYGGNSLYTGAPAGRAYKVSYNRPFVTRGNQFARASLFGAEYPMVRWLEANGYHVSYSTGIDSDRRGNEMLEHKVFLSVGHDEYWSGNQRTNVEAARAAGIHLAFFSGDEIFWKTRWENSISASATPYRTLVTYKETHAGAKIDPLPTVWTGTWRDPRFSPPADGGRPENALSGTKFAVNCCDTTPRGLRISEAEGKLRFWRHTSLASLNPGQTATVAPGILGYEWDEDLDNGFRPPGLMRLSTSTYNVSSKLLDYGSSFGSGTATHALTLYRAASGSLVFGAGTIRWSWALDINHDADAATASISSPEPIIQQATVNLFADMGAQPLTLQPALVIAGPSTDTLAPTSTIASPTAGTTLPAGVTVSISGTASDSGGIVSAVEVSVDGGITWHRATGKASWTYSWNPETAGAATIRSRAIDDSANIQAPGTQVGVTVGPRTCPCTIWTPSDTPAVASNPEDLAVELGVRFRSDLAGFITGMRFYKGVGNTGTHVGKLWTANGTLLRSVTFTNETASGWQQTSFSSPVAIAANTAYVASYHTSTGHYSSTSGYFAATGKDSAPLHALQNGVNGNGLYVYGPSAFPTLTYNSTNYWVDVVFQTSGTPDTTPPLISGVGATPTSTNASITWTTNEASDSIVDYGTDPSALTSRISSPALTISHTVVLPSLNNATTYSYRVRSADASGNSATSPAAPSAPASFTTTSLGCPCTIWPPTATPAVASVQDALGVELGVKFSASVNGTIAGIRFYKGAQNTGTHTGNLWSTGGTLLGSAVFSNESASGWQQVTFPTPVAVTAGTTYVASYHTTSGFYSADGAYFQASGVTNGPLQALANGVSAGNGVYRYGTTSGFPTLTYNSNNYWVDVVFFTSGTSDTSAALSIADVTVTEGNSGTLNAALVVTLSQATAQTVTVNYTTANGTAFAPGDYTASTGSLSFAPGTTTAQVTVPVVGDTRNEINETLTVRLSGATNAALADSTGLVTIVDNDPVPSLTIADVTRAEGNSGSANAVFTVTLNAVSGRPVSVNYATANVTASGGADYTTTTGTLSFAPGVRTRQITVPVRGDILDEANETFQVNLSGAVAATFTDSRGIGTIADDDPLQPSASAT